MVDGDDLLAPGALAKMLDTLLRNPDADAVFGRWKRFEGEFNADASAGREHIHDRQGGSRDNDVSE